ncbi:glycosyltransferase [Campylobacter curvus]|uniref:glycosyltransferase n=1 Tax=Campylobacter curvus TaxID=200 RepID=UPI00146FF742|nr:glycosyltransferase [Campylobacter curvus]
MKDNILILHYEFFSSYFNKNIGYFIDSAISRSYGVDFLTLSKNIHDNSNKIKFKLIGINGNSLESFSLYKYLFLNRDRYKYVWLYPSYKYFIILLLFLKFLKIKVIIKTDNISIDSTRKSLLKNVLWKLKKSIMVVLSYKIIVENYRLASFFKSNKTLMYGLGLPKKNIKIISCIDANRKKNILYIGRIVYAKGLDRLINIFNNLVVKNKIESDYRLIVVGKIVDEKYYQAIVQKVESLSYLKHRVVFDKEKYEKDYYAEILKAALVVLPTRNEGLPNILGDCFFCNTLFLTTHGAKAKDVILNDTFFCKNNDANLEKSIIKILNNIEYYYSIFQTLYNKNFFIETDTFFESIIQ